MNKYKFSIIVPVYNTEIEFLSKCFKSIINQTFTNYEVILVNDCSSSKTTIEYLKQESSKHSWKLINHAVNKGLGMTRNTGIEHSTGEYLLFIDSDDWIEKDMLKIIYEYDANKKIKEFACFNFLWVRKMNTIINTELIFKYKDLNIYGAATAWSKVYNRNFIYTNNIKFDNSKLPHEDEFWFLCIMSQVTSMDIIDLPLYYYNKVNDESIMNNLNGAASLTALNDYLSIFLIKWNSKNYSEILWMCLIDYYFKPLYIVYKYKDLKFSQYVKAISQFRLLGKILYQNRKIGYLKYIFLYCKVSNFFVYPSLVFYRFLKK